MKKFILPLLAVFIFSAGKCDMEMTKPQEIKTQLWRDLHEQKITEEEYSLKVGMMNKLEDQWDAAVDKFKQIEGVDYENDEAGCGGMTRIRTPEENAREDNNREEMKAFRERIDQRAQQIYEWDPNADKRVSQGVTPDFGDNVGVENVAFNPAMGADIHSGLENVQVTDRDERV